MAWMASAKRGGDFGGVGETAGRAVERDEFKRHFCATVIITCWSLAFGPRLTSQTLLPGAFFARLAAS
jgi:hypothetical protein